jgi:regulatory helix-turn-helix LysR family protein
MLSEHVTVETGGTKLSRRFSSPVQGHLRSLEKDGAKNYQNYIKAENAQLRMIDLNLFRVFDAMMLHRSVRKASQILSVTPSAVSHALSRLRQSRRRALHPDRVRQPTNATRASVGLRRSRRMGETGAGFDPKGRCTGRGSANFRVGVTNYPCML